METFNHVGSEWHLRHVSVQDGKGGHKKWEIVAGKDWSIKICELPGWDEDDEANARLIAAAPQMLATLKQARESMLEIVNNPFSEQAWKNMSEIDLPDIQETINLSELSNRND